MQAVHSRGHFIAILEMSASWGEAEGADGKAAEISRK
jgi:hypothetical protein